MTSSALVATEMGLQVRRFPSVAAARAAQANIESNGIGAALREVICCWCGKPTGAAVLCDQTVLKAITDGMCQACEVTLCAPLPPLSSVVASRQSPCSRGVNRTAAPFARREHASGSPAPAGDS